MKLMFELPFSGCQDEIYSTSSFISDMLIIFIRAQLSFAFSQPLIILPFCLPAFDLPFNKFYVRD